MDVSPRQVLIEATIAEVTLSGRLKYGLQWFFNNNVGRDYDGNGSLGLPNNLTLTDALKNIPAGQFSYAITDSAGIVKALLTALASEMCIRDRGGTLQSTQVLPPTEEGNAVKVIVSAAINGDIDSLRKVLYDLEAQTPLLFVDNLQVSARENRPRLPSGRFANYTRVQLSTQFEVSGYLRKEGG